MQKTKSTKDKNVILVTYKDDADGKGYNESRSYDGHFAGTQILRTIVGICNDTLFEHKYNVEATLTAADLVNLKEVIEALLQKGETKNAN